MEAVIYSNGSQECERIKSLLESLTPIVHVYVLGKQFTEDQFKKEFGEKATILKLQSDISMLVA